MPEEYLNKDVRHDFVLFFDVSDGNPNGDPDADNAPRMDPQTRQGLVTDVSIKRKVRDWVAISKEDAPPYRIYIRRNIFLTDLRKSVLESRGFKSNDDKRIPEAQRILCDEFFDVRMFGAVMSMKEWNGGQVRGPIQMTFARSIDPIVTSDVSIGRIAQENAGERNLAAETGTFGRKSIVRYGLYRAHGFFTPHFAKQTSVTSEDLDVFWEALEKMWWVDHSAARPAMTTRGLYVFSHQSPLGNAPWQRLTETIRVERQAPNGKASSDEPIRSFADYSITLPRPDELPSGVTLNALVS